MADTMLEFACGTRSYGYAYRGSPRGAGREAGSV